MTPASIEVINPSSLCWERIREAKKEPFLVFAADYFDVTSLEPGRYVTVLDSRSKEVLDRWRASTPRT